MKNGIRAVAAAALALVLIAAACTVKKEEPEPTTVAAPAFSPQAATYSAEIDVAISTATSGATIRYTTDGSTPAETNGTVYTAPVHIAASLTLKAVAYRSGWTTSQLTSGDYTIAPLVSTPAFNPAPGEYLAAQDVTITTATVGASIRYTTDGSTPTETNGAPYAGPVAVSHSLTLKAVAYQSGWTTSPVRSGEYLIGPPAEAPVFSPPAGEYADAQDVTITTASSGASIRYTTDGSTPTEASGTLYTGPVPVAASLTLKAVAFGTGYRASAVTSGAYVIGFNVVAPAFSPAPGTYQEAQDVAISTTTANAAIRYTTDGSTPTEAAGALYTAPVRLSASATLRAVAYRTGWATSPVTSGDYVIGETVAAPQFGVTPGYYATARDVAITTTTAGASIRYTTDGSTPTEAAGTLYTAPVHVARTLTLKAVAYRSGWTTSSVATGEYKRAGIAAGRFHTMLAKSDGTCWTWGGNYEGQIGDGTTTPRPAPARVEGLSNIVAVAAGFYHSVALTSDGAVWAWGRNQYGQIGDNSTTERLSPVEITAITGVTAAAGGENSTYALKSDGTVWAWGGNGDGQLGDGTTNNRYLPVRVQGLTSVTAIAAGNIFGLALKSDGTVWAWGNNLYGQLGDGTTNPRLVPVQVPGLAGVTAIAASGYHAAAVKGDGTVWCWGSGSYGELGNGAQPMSQTTPVLATGLTTGAAAGAGVGHTAVILADRTLRAFGWNLYGQLGDGTNSNSSTAVAVPGVSAVVAADGGVDDTIAILGDGSVWAWGHNADYQLGDGTTTDRWTPVRIIQ
ncbi:MAG: chitobiase/beta-hexosaminidase C-terminal domain-containing protein [Acidobacteriota bacterium]